MDMYVSGHEHLTEGAEARDGIAKLEMGGLCAVERRLGWKGAK